ncbi:MAG: His/Gly/Thr/Pro-type tRNA ligase C-terminal domain-containing protein, partial [Spirochaetota bacterium]|nr:His/Gly/Thr/Pro-type tRNA ligase C-terminal domain-containing protein [Spirochaetota bacterium]
MERFIGILIEHYGGKFPLWLAPVQVKLVPIIEKHQDYAERLKKVLRAENIRVEIDRSDEKLGYKIRKSQLEKIPFMVILGDKELENESLSVRSRESGDLGDFSIDLFIKRLRDEIGGKVVPNKEKAEVSK